VVRDILQRLSAGGKPDLLIIVPPFGGIDRPSLGVHLLQSVARQAGHKIRILYANLLLAHEIGVELYTAICYAPTADLLGERFFTAAAFGQEPKGEPTFGNRHTHRRVADCNPAFDYDRFTSSRRQATSWCDNIALSISKQELPIVGTTTTFEQTAASIAILERVKRLSPHTITIIGGANCEGEMSRGIASLSSGIDHIFSGESETSLVGFLEQIKAGGRPGGFIEGNHNFDLDAIPTPDFDDYYTQFEILMAGNHLIKPEALWLPYETSRGCWWGQKHHCTFCGINGQGMAFRSKSADRVIAELKTLRSKHPSNKILMVDNIMPHKYFNDLLPRLENELSGLHIFYEQKANLTLDKLSTLKRAGVAVIQPGIEALSTPLLKLMKKGVTAAQNIALLRYARSVRIAVTWNLLYAFPNDEGAWFKETASILPLIRHLPPPTGLYQLSIDRFSPYHNEPSTYGLQNMRPGEVYDEVFPNTANLTKLAYHFRADYPSGSLQDSDSIAAVSQEIASWIASWKADEIPQLLVSRLGKDEYIMFDSRGISDTNMFEFIDEEQAAVALFGVRAAVNSDAIRWGLQSKVCLPLEGQLVPLAVGSTELMREFEVRQLDSAAAPVFTQPADRQKHSHQQI